MDDSEQTPLIANKVYENVARMAQQFLAERPVVVLGTGATISHGLPSMGELADELLTSIDTDSPGWGEFSVSLRETMDLELTLHDIALPVETVDRIVRVTWEMVSSRDIIFFNKILGRPIEFPLADLFKFLLRTADSHIRVVTTNYDRVAEYAANRIGAYVSTGVTNGWLQRFVPTSVDSERLPSPGYDGLVTILKVHGSLDWFRDVMGNIVGVPLSDKIPENTAPLVVTPGVSKYREVHKDPFRTVMSAADTVLRNASCYICVGYGFSDEHVQPVLVNQVIKNNIPLIIVTKQLTQPTREAFLTQPPKKFLFIEESLGGGSTVYNPEYPAGIQLADISLWELGNFMKMATGEEAR